MTTYILSHINQHLYDVFGVVLIGVAANVIINGAGNNNEYILLGVGILFIVCGGNMLVLRSIYEYINKKADANQRECREAMLEKELKEEAGIKVSDNIKDLALKGTSEKEEFIDMAIDRFLSSKGKKRYVFFAGIISPFFTVIGFIVLYFQLFSPPNVSIYEEVHNTNSENHEKTIEEIRALREELKSLSVELDSNNTRIVENVITARETVFVKLASIHANLATLSSLVKNTKDRTLQSVIPKKSGTVFKDTTEIVR